MKQVVDALSITSPDINPAEIPLFLTSTKFEPKLYGKCVRRFMNRLGVKPCEEDMFVLRNAVMSPFPTQGNSIGHLMEEFEKVIEEKVQVCRERNKKGSKEVKFLVQGNARVFLVLQTSFHWATLRQQVIVEAQLDDDLHKSYTRLKAVYPGDTIILKSEKEIDLEAELNQVLKGGTSEFGAEIYRKKDRDTPTTEKDHPDKGKVTITRVVKSRPLNSIYRDLEYPSKFMPFYLYGTKEEMHITHMLLKAPNAALSASNVTFREKLEDKLGEDADVQLASGLIVTLSKFPEVSMQPFLTDEELRKPGSEYVLPEKFPFKSQGEFEVEVWKDPNEPESKGPGLLNGLGRSFGTFTMTMGVDVDVDAKGPNELPPGITRPVDRTVERKLEDIEKMIKYPEKKTKNPGSPS